MNFRGKSTTIAPLFNPPDNIMPEFKPGQRWISDTELQLGLATVTAVEPRTVTLEFPATGEQRTYAIQTAPLTRVRIPDGDNIQDRDGNPFTVLSHREDNGLITYAVKNCDGTRGELPEGELNHRIQLSRPTACSAARSTATRHSNCATSAVCTPTASPIHRYAG